MSNKVSNFPNANVQKRKPDQVRDELDVFRQIMELPPIDLKSGAAVKQRINTYLNICLDAGLMPTVQGASLALKIHRNTFWEWSNQASERGRACQAFKGLQASMMENAMINGTTNPVTGIFLLKNHHGYSDTLSIEATPAREPLPTTEQIRQRLAAANGLGLPGPDENGDI